MTLAPSIRSRAFSMIELVIVVVIIGIIAAIAIPRMSRGVSGAADAALQSNLATLRKALDLYQAEHNGKYPALTDVKDALTTYTDENGAGFSAAKDSTSGVIFGPYLAKIPPLPVGARKGNTKIAGADASDVGWIYVQASGKITANTSATEKDDRGTLYSDY